MFNKKYKLEGRYFYPGLESRLTGNISEQHDGLLVGEMGKLENPIYTPTQTFLGYQNLRGEIYFLRVPCQTDQQEGLRTFAHFLSPKEDLKNGLAGEYIGNKIILKYREITKIVRNGASKKNIIKLFRNIGMNYIKNHIPLTVSIKLKEK